MFTCIHCPNPPEGATLVDFAYSFSPLVEETAPDCVVLDVAGCELRFGSAYELANEISNYATRSQAEGGLGRSINVCLASNPDTAILAAKNFKGITFIASGEELTALGDLPIEKLLSLQSPVSSLQSPSRNSNSNAKTLDLGLWTLDLKRAEEILETLGLWGVRTFGDFARLPTTGVSERLGQEGIKLQQLASGKTERHLKLKQPAPVFNLQLDLEYPIAELEPLSFIFARLLNQLCASLLAYALATNELRVQLKLEEGTTHERTLCLPVPLRDHKTFLKLLLLDTESHPPQKAVLGVAIACEPVKPRVLQSGLFIPQAPEPAKLELTLARLTKLLGRGKVGSPEVIDTHRPDAFQINRFVVVSASQHKRQRRGEKGQAETRGGDGEKGRKGETSPLPRGSLSPRLGFRMFRPPLRAMVDASRGYPQQISAWGAHRSVYGKVVRLAGPWRKTGDWWRDDAWARDEWDVAVEPAKSGAADRARVSQILYRIYRELRSGAWFVEGSYD